MPMTVAYTSYLKIKKHAGAYRTALLKNFDEPINFGIHGGIDCSCNADIKVV